MKTFFIASRMKTMIVPFLFVIIFVTSAKAQTWMYINRNQAPIAPTLPFPDAQFKYKLLGVNTRNQLTAIELQPLHGGIGSYLHTREDKIFFVVNGQIQFFVNGTQFCATTGDYVFIPRNINQAYRVQNPTFDKPRPRLQMILFPSGNEGFYRDVAIFYIQGGRNATLTDSIARQYGLIPSGPVEWDDMGCFD